MACRSKCQCSWVTWVENMWPKEGLKGVSFQWKPRIRANRGDEVIQANELLASPRPATCVRQLPRRGPPREEVVQARDATGPTEAGGPSPAGFPERSISPGPGDPRAAAQAVGLLLERRRLLTECAARQEPETAHRTQE